MLTNLTMLVLFQVLGDLVQQLTGLPVPGPVIGMALLFLGLIGEGNLPETVDGAANEILHYLPMLLVPAGVGMLHLSGLVDGEWPGRAAAIVGSSTLAIAITGLVMIWLDRCPQLSPETQENLEFHQSTAGRR